MHLIPVSANKLAEFISAKTPDQRRSLVRTLRRAAAKKSDFAPYYSAFRGPAKKCLSERNSAFVLAALLKMESRKSATGDKWIDRDSALTIEAFKALIAAAPALDALDVRFTPRKSRLKAQIFHEDVAVTATPDLMVAGQALGQPAIGAFRFFIAKDPAYELSRHSAELIAGMQYLWLSGNWTGQEIPMPELCMVMECFQNRITRAPHDVTALKEEIHSGCQLFSRYWHSLDSEEAA